VGVIVASAERYTTDGAGEIVLSNNVTLPATLEVDSAEYLLRETVFRGGETTFSLWPRDSPTGLDEELTRRLVYTEAAGGAPGALRLRRLSPGRVSLVPSAAILADSEAVSAHQNAALALTHATGGEVEFAVEEEATSAMVIRTSVDAQDPAMGRHAALTYREVDGSRITGARVVFTALTAARSTALVMHELGHGFGLEHSLDARDLMYPVVASGKRLSGREALAIDLMLKRRPGNRFPDNDREGAAGLGRRRLPAVSCGR
jgi:hypothetical protein